MGGGEGLFYNFGIFKLSLLYVRLNLGLSEFPK